MQVSITFKNIESSERLKNFVKEKLGKLDRLFDSPAKADVTLSVEKFRRIAEVNISGDRLNIIGKEETEDMYASIDMVLDKLEKQIKKKKEKIKQRRTG
ncbi:MAG: ribosomal subunit interface protein [Desulfococcus sp. 4484_241]|nr:MAG: ribosomal subunit interface protein [Desulfococcus sp. 4484_241]